MRTSAPSKYNGQAVHAFVRAIQYSSKPDAHVLDLFGGLARHGSAASRQAVGIAPRPLTLRQLLAMAEGHGRDQWSRWSVLMAMLANLHHAPKKSRALTPAMFNPYALAASADVVDRDDPESMAGLSGPAETI